MIGLVLLYVGAVLWVNGLWLLGRAEGREIAIMNLMAAFVGMVVAVAGVIRGDANSVQLAGYVLLFAFTYLWVAYNQFTGADGRGLGWYCLFVALTAVPIAVQNLGQAATTFSWWLGLSWAAWALLWFLYFLMLALKQPIGRLTAFITILQAILTAWVPGFLVLSGALSAG